MPSLQQSYRQWLSSAPSNVAVIEAADVAHPSWGSFRIAKWAKPIDILDEKGETHTYVAGFFALAMSSVSDSVEQSVSASISDTQGVFYDALRSMSVEERKLPITITHRLVRSDEVNGGVYGPVLINPPPIWTVHSISIRYDAVVLELRAQPLRIRRIGLYYVSRTFPVLTFA